MGVLRPIKLTLTCNLNEPLQVNYGIAEKASDVSGDRNTHMGCVEEGAWDSDLA